jgi:hypothetical protein
LTDRRGLLHRVILILVSAALGVPVFAAIVADHPAPRWLAVLAAAGIVGAFGGLVVLVVDSIRTRTHRPGYFFPDRLRRGDEMPDELVDRIRIPGWLNALSNAIVILVLMPLLDRYDEPWWLDISAYGAVIVCSLILESTIWSAYRRLRRGE